MSNEDDEHDPTECPSCGYRNFATVDVDTFQKGRFVQFKNGGINFEGEHPEIIDENGIYQCIKCHNKVVNEDGELVLLDETGDADPKRVDLHHSGEFTTIDIDGVADNSVAIDFKKGTPRLLVHEDYSDEPSQIIELPEVEKDEESGAGSVSKSGP